MHSRWKSRPAHRKPRGVLPSPSRPQRLGSSPGGAPARCGRNGERHSGALGKGSRLAIWPGNDSGQDQVNLLPTSAAAGVGIAGKGRIRSDGAKPKGQRSLKRPLPELPVDALNVRSGSEPATTRAGPGRHSEHCSDYGLSTVTLNGPASDAACATASLTSSSGNSVTAQCRRSSTPPRTSPTIPGTAVVWNIH